MSDTPFDPDSPPALPDEAIVVRGGKSELEHMKESVERTYRKQDENGQPREPLLSVFTHPTDDVGAIVGRGPILRQWSSLRVTTAGALRAAGFEVSEPDKFGHASLKLPDPPADEDYERLDAVFSEPRKLPPKEQK